MRRAIVLAVVAALCAGCTVASSVPGSGPATPRASVTRPEPPATISPEPPRVDEQLVRIQGELVELQHLVATLAAASSRHDDQLVGFERRLGELAERRSQAEGVPRGFAPSSSVPGSRGATSSTAPAADLQSDAQAMVRSRDYDAAVLIFYELITNYPTHPLRESAQFSIGDIYFTQREYRSALREFENLVAAVPNGARTADALVKIGRCRRALGDEEGARRAWERVLAEHARSEAARQARDLLRPAPPRG